MSERDLLQWQTRLVSFMVSMVVFSAVIFTGFSIREFERVQETLAVPLLSSTEILSAYDRIKPGNFQEATELADRRTAFVLERESLAHRYSQAHALILSGLWTRFMAFVTGTLMSLIGAAFILGKLQESTSSLSGSGAGLTMSLTSTSPGIVLAVLGTILISAGLYLHVEVHTTDPPSYITREPVASDEGGLSADVANAAPAGPQASIAPISSANK